MSEFSDWRDSRFDYAPRPNSFMTDYWISKNPNDYLFYNTRMLRNKFEKEKNDEATS